ncbi:MAG: diphthine--ammonia ligase [Proteobacteria bacterium]|nr:diphthine--ammonia ligase [Pseudomonadota bacterium]MBU4287491.1 diphthine--ammonia ligase [Pseudomonadota bacterium]MBU4414022.1 diphthine--ammonia ligase [Pseudomonadota bacterium]MCG2756860.1 diphthine--ammonia ligase [Desulfobacteraceae bacterium]
MNAIKKKDFFCSWSGGKDSCLALYHAINNGGMAKYLLTMLNKDGSRTRSHGLSENVIKAQAASLGIPLVVGCSSWDDYEKVFVSAILEFKQGGIEYGVFGDIDLDEHLQWVERICSSAHLQAYEPLWKRSRMDLLEEFLDLGFRATIVSVKKSVLDKSFLGCSLSRKMVALLQKTGVDPSGEKGEYHTVVTDGPIFSAPINLVTKGIITRNDYNFIDLGL